MPPVLTTVAYILHAGAGMIALIAGFTAVWVRKGGRLHRRAGTVFVAAMAVMAIFAGYLAVAVPGQLVNLFIAFLVLYLLATAWMTVRRKPHTGGTFEKAALLVAICLSAPFVILSFQILAGLTPWVKSTLPFRGPIVIALYSFTAVLVLAAIGDARLVVAGGVAGAPRITRHLWRMFLGLTLATGSAFTNGFARLLPGPYHVPPSFFYPQFIPLALLLYWMIRIRFMGPPPFLRSGAPQP